MPPFGGEGNPSARHNAREHTSSMAPDQLRAVSFEALPRAASAAATASVRNVAAIRVLRERTILRNERAILRTHCPANAQAHGLVLVQ